LEELDSYTHYHFEAEERHMKSIGYKNLEKHISEHKYFADRIHTLIHNKDVNDSLVSKETVLYLWKWLMDHVMTEDKKYSSQLKRRL
jgi:hemerythrin